MSELSAGQWQPKQTLAQKAFLNVDIPRLRSPSARTRVRRLTWNFRFTSSEPSNVSVTQSLLSMPRGVVLGAAGYSDSQPLSDFESGLVAQATLEMPESPLSIVELQSILPMNQDVDLNQEPTFALVDPHTLSGWLPAPAQYAFSGQDLVHGSYSSNNPGSVPLNVLCATTSAGLPTSITLLGKIINPHIAVPPQEPVFDSAYPFLLLISHGYTLFSRATTRFPARQRNSPILLTSSSGPPSIISRPSIIRTREPFCASSKLAAFRQLMARKLQLKPNDVRGWTLKFQFSRQPYNPQPLRRDPRIPAKRALPDPRGRGANSLRLCFISKVSSSAPIRSITGRFSTTSRCS